MKVFFPIAVDKALVCLVSKLKKKYPRCDLLLSIPRDDGSTIEAGAG